MDRLKKSIVLLSSFFMFAGPVLTVSATEIIDMQDMEGGFIDVDGDIESVPDPVVPETEIDTQEDTVFETMEENEKDSTVSGNDNPDPDLSHDPGIADTVSGNVPGSFSGLTPQTVINNYSTYTTTVEETEEYTFLEKPFEEYTVLEGFSFLIFLFLCFLSFMNFFKWRSGKWRI